MLLLSQKSVEIERCIDGEQPSCQTFMRLLKSEGRSVVVITHTIEHAHRVADRFVILSHGKVFGEWRKDELSEHDLFARLMEAER